MTEISVPSLDPLIGRDSELARLVGLLRQSRLVTLTGPGGAGKTRLAVAVAHELGRQGQDAVVVDCSSVTERSTVPHLVATALDVPPDSSDSPTTSIANTLSGRSLVLVLDNLEQIEGVAALVVELLRGSDGLSVLATSRRALGIRGEVEFSVQPLALPSDATPHGLETSPAGALFLARWRTVGGDGALDDATARDVARLLERLDGLPLAIELAAGRMRALAPAEIVRRLDDRGIEAIEDRDGDEHRSLRAVLGWTLSQLSDADSRALEAMCVTGGADADLIDALVDGSRALESVESLLGVGLVQRSGIVDGVSRFRVLETIRATVVRGLDPDRLAALRQRHADHVMDLAMAWDRAAEAGGGKHLLERFEAEADNVRRALDWLLATDPRRALLLLSYLEAFWKLHARLAEGYARFRDAVAAAPEPGVELARAASRQLRDGWMLLSTPQYHEFAEWTIEIARASGDSESLVEALRQRAYLAFNENDPRALEAVAAELETLSPSIGERTRIDIMDVRAVRAALIEGRTSDEFVEQQERYIEALTAAGHALRRPLARGNLAGAYLGRGEFAKAAREASEIVAEFRALDQPYDTAWALAFLAPALAGMGRLPEAIDAALECAAISIEVGDPENIASGLWAAMPVALAAGQPTLAATLYAALTHGLAERGQIALNAMDAALATRWLDEARKRASNVAVEVALREGRSADPVALLRALPERLGQSGPRSAVDAVLKHGGLTRREIEVLRLVGLGRSDPEIAAELFISPKTASVHVTNIKGKLSVDSRLQVALKARELGLVGTPEPS